MKITGEFEKQSSPDPVPSPHSQETTTPPPWPVSEAVFLSWVKQYWEWVGAPGTAENNAPEEASPGR